MIEIDEFYEISRGLEKHHSVFYALWDVGKIIFTETVPRAGVQFDLEGNALCFYFNPEYWKTLTLHQKEFVICHECLHIVLNHGARIRDSKEQERTNIAIDIVVNHMLLNKFGFDRTQLDNDYCWVDNIFPEGTPDNMHFEYYYNLLPSIPCKYMTVDSHDGLANSDWRELGEQINNKLSPSEKEFLKDIVDKHFEKNPAGKNAGNWWTFVNIDKVKPKKKWETIIKQWSKKYLKNDHKDMEQWAVLNRRFVFLKSDMFIPSEMEIEHETYYSNKIDVHFYMDTSGSCRGHSQRFFNAAKSLPKERFDVKVRCFDTQVYDVDTDIGKLYGYGGTSFQVIEQSILNNMQLNKSEYPESVFVVTDGMGDHVQPKYPERWHFFLTYDYKRYIPKESLKNTYDLKDFE